MENELTPEQRFEKLLANIQAEIQLIDAATKWSEVEPDWWLSMSNLKRITSAYLINRTPIKYEK